jgi:hypothetical protein
MTAWYHCGTVKVSPWHRRLPPLASGSITARPSTTPTGCQLSSAGLASAVGFKIRTPGTPYTAPGVPPAERAAARRLRPVLRHRRRHRVGPHGPAHPLGTDLPHRRPPAARRRPGRPRPERKTYNDSYTEDDDNYIDIILDGSLAAARRITTVQIPSAGRYHPLYNPGGPGNNPAPGVRYSAPSPPISQPVTIALANPQTITYIHCPHQPPRWRLPSKCITRRQLEPATTSTTQP